VSRRYQDNKERRSFTFAFNREKVCPLGWCSRSKKLRKVRRRDGRYPLCADLTDQDPGLLKQYYVQFVAGAESFCALNGDAAICPAFHHDETHIEPILSSHPWPTAT